MKKLFLLLLVTILLAACGKKGSLLPPESLRPAPVSNLQVGQQGEALVVSWSRPGKEEGGRKLRDLTSMQLFRREVLPRGEDCEACPGAYRLMTTVELDYPKGVTVLGDAFFWYDTAVARELSYRYKVISRNSEGAVSRASNLATRKKVAHPPAPLVKAVSTPTSIQLSWQPPELPGSQVAGYNVYRKRNAEPFPPLPLNPSPLKETSFEDFDARHGVRYSYGVATVAVTEGEPVESERSLAVEGALTEAE